ncbi:MAG: hypothetical protein ABSA84_05415 [Gammaproteobacteria bacterium]|jgi:hypothetical protein
MTKKIISSEYKILLEELKKRVTATRYKATISVNKDLILLYHHIGKQILAAQTKECCGAK